MGSDASGGEPFGDPGRYGSIVARVDDDPALDLWQGRQQGIDVVGQARPDMGIVSAAYGGREDIGVAGRVGGNRVSSASTSSAMTSGRRPSVSIVKAETPSYIGRRRSYT